MARARPAEGFYEELFPEIVDDFSDDDTVDAFTDSEDDEYVVEQGEGAKEPLPDR